MTQLGWTDLHAPHSNAAPALAGQGDRLQAAVVTTAGSVVASSTTSLADGWGPWQEVGAGSGHAALRAAPGTTPLLLARDDDTLLLLCHGQDDNLHLSTCPPGGRWSGWMALTTDASVVEGRITATVTTGPRLLHVSYPGTGQTLHYRRFDASMAPDGAYSWRNVREGLLTSDGSGEVLVARRTIGDDVTFLRLDAPWTGAWEPVVTERGTPMSYRCLALGDLVHHAGAFHLLFVWQTRLDVDDLHGIEHVRVRPRQYDTGFFTSVHRFTPNRGRMPVMSLGSWRGRLLAAFSDEHDAVRYAWLDDLDRDGEWRGERPVAAAGRTRDRIVLSGADFRAGKGWTDLNTPAFGNDLFALIRDPAGPTTRFINFTRAMTRDRLTTIGHDVDWCTAYPGGTLDFCGKAPATSDVQQLPVYTEVGHGSISLPERAMHELFTRVMDHEGKPQDPYMTWIATEPRGSAGFGPGLNVDPGASSWLWHHEMLHRLLTSLRVVDEGQSGANPNLMTDLIPSSVVTDGEKLFGSGTNGSSRCEFGTDGARCRGFTNDLGSNYDVSARQHSFIGVIQAYLRDGRQLREQAYSDLRAGLDLLWDKYCWVREHLFDGVELEGENTPAQVVTLTNAHSGKVLDVTGWALTNGTPLQQYRAHGGDNQRFLLRPKGEGYVQIAAMHSGRCLDVTAVSTADGALVQQYTASAGHNQQWRLVPDRNGAYEIVARHSGKCLEVVGWSQSDKGAVAQYERHGGANQLWLLGV